jgi:hypothetical protein
MGFWFVGNTTYTVYTAISVKVVHEQSGKVEYERERLLGIANKLINFQSGSQQPFALVFDFSALLVDNLIEIAVYVLFIGVLQSLQTWF